MLGARKSLIYNLLINDRDVVIFSETRLSPSIRNTRLGFNQYNVYLYDRSN